MIQNFGLVYCLVHPPALVPMTLISRPVPVVRWWQVTGIPCSYALTVLRDKELQREKYCDNYFPSVNFSLIWKIFLSNYRYESINRNRQGHWRQTSKQCSKLGCSREHYIQSQGEGKKITCGSCCTYGYNEGRATCLPLEVCLLLKCKLYTFILLSPNFFSHLSLCKIIIKSKSWVTINIWSPW